MKIKDVVAYKGCVPLTENAEDYYCKNSPGIIGIFIFLNSFSKFKVVFHHHKSERINHSQDFKFFFCGSYSNEIYNFKIFNYNRHFQN